jgi:hypothetical protein
MAQFLLIENPGTSPVECYTTLGMSLTRFTDIPGLIGEKGSGFKHGVLLCLRHGLNPMVYSGTMSIEFFARPKQLTKGHVVHTYNAVHYHLKGTDPSGARKTQQNVPTSFTLEFGVYDWPNLAMGLREFVSNAHDGALVNAYEANDQDIDKVGLSYLDDLVIKVVDEKEKRAKAGYTRIYIPMNSEVEEFYNTRGKRFLHLSEPSLLGRKVLPKADRNIGGGRMAVIYKKGVLVREIAAHGHGDADRSLFDYNLGDELTLDDSRNIEDYRATDAVARALRDADEATLTRIFEAVRDGEQVWETGLYGLREYGYAGMEKTKERRKAAWGKAIERAAGPNAVLVPDVGSVIERVQEKGHTPIVVKAGGWLDAATELDLPTDKVVLSEADRRGTTFVDPPRWLADLHDRVWATVLNLGLDNGREKPSVRCFREIADGKALRTAFYDPSTRTCNHNEEVLGEDALRTLANVIEEIGHHTTGSLDFTRSFQDYFIRMAAVLMKQAWDRAEAAD